MPDARPRDEVFAIISIVTLLFLLIGISIGVFQWVSSTQPKPPVFRPSRESTAPDLLKGSGEGELGGAEGGSSSEEGGGGAEEGAETGAPGGSPEF